MKTEVHMLRQDACVTEYRITEYPDRIEAVLSFHPVDDMQTMQTVKEIDQWQDEVVRKYRIGKKTIIVTGPDGKRHVLKPPCK